MPLATAELEKVLTELPEREKRRVFSLLARQLTQKNDPESFGIEVLDDSDLPLGYFVALKPIPLEQFPPLSKEYLAEIERRAATPEETEPMEEWLERFTSPVEDGPEQHRRSK